MTLFRTHTSFAQNPLLLTIMLLTFDRFAEIPCKMHIFCREAFLALSVTHDASKGAFKRALKTGLNIDEVEVYSAEICFRSYRGQKYEFTEEEYPVIYYEHGEVNEFSLNEPQSYILKFILWQIPCDYSLTISDFPLVEPLVSEEVMEDAMPLAVHELDDEGHVIGTKMFS